jgi:hypothetical protein
VRKKTAELETRKSKMAGLCKAIAALNSYVRHFIRSSGNQLDPEEDFEFVLKSAIDLEGDEIRKKQIKCNRTEQKFSEVDYVLSVKEEYERRMRAKEAEIDQILIEARKRRLKLQAELDTALEQIKSLRGSQGPENDSLMDDLENSNREFKKITVQLDQTLHVLERELGPHARDEL